MRTVVAAIHRPGLLDRHLVEQVGSPASRTGQLAGGAVVTPRRIQLSRAKGWRKPEGAVVVARPTRWGNPFPVAEHGRAEAVQLYREWLAGRPDLLAAARSELAGRDLACWCRPDEECHADVLLAVANGGAS
jgi:hypothetical protein